MSLVGRRNFVHLRVDTETFNADSYRHLFVEYSTVLRKANKLESEGFDQPDLTLPFGQNSLIAAVAAANPNAVVLLQTGNPIDMPWRDSVKAIMEAWYPGQAGGQARDTTSESLSCSLRAIARSAPTSLAIWKVRCAPIPMSAYVRDGIETAVTLLRGPTR